MNLSRVRVRAGYTAGALAMFFAEPTRDSLLAGGAVAMVGELIRIWASGHIEKTHRLATGGPYAHTRNPLYAGSVLMALGFLVAARHPISVTVGLAYLAIFYPFIIREEARFLKDRFQNPYHDWAQHVPLFFPRLTPGGPRESTFQFARVLANHEWRSLLGLAVLCAFMVWRLG